MEAALPMGSTGPIEKPILFCPFCRECFEGETTCPEHELTLVPFEKLPRDEEGFDGGGIEEDVAPLEWRYGRAEIAAGALLILLSFVMPMVHIVVEDGPSRSFSGLDAATGPAPNLWTLPFVPAMFLAFLGRLRSLQRMAGARLAALMVSLGPALALGYSFVHIARGAAERAALTGHPETVSPGIAVIVVGVRTVLLAIDSLRFGRAPLAAIAPPGHVHDETESPIAMDEPDGAAPRAPSRRRRRR